MIEIRDVSKQYGKVPALINVSMKVDPGRLMTVLGPSGTGKTTLLRLIAGFERVDSGGIWLYGKQVSGSQGFIPPFKRKLSMIFQNLSLWPHMTVKEHLEFVNAGTGSSGDDAPVDDALEQFKLTGLRKRFPHQLSGGEQQRLAIARALINRPTLLLMDEPFSHVDFLLKKELLSMLQGLRQDLEVTIVYVTHDLDECLTLADDVSVMEEGRLVFCGSKEKFSTAYAHWLERI